MEPTRKDSLWLVNHSCGLLFHIHKPDPNRNKSLWQDALRIRYTWRLETQRFVANPAGIAELLNTYVGDLASS